MYHVAIVGATGLVGSQFLQKLEEVNFPIKSIRLLASSQSAGKTICFQGEEIIVEELKEDSFQGIDIALFSAGGEMSRHFAPIAVESGAVVVDNSSCWRQDPSVGLVVPEVNFDDVNMNRLIANPNCSTIQSILPVKAIHDAFHVTRIHYNTYQAVSGSGMKGIRDLEQTQNNEEPIFYPYNISKTCIPEIDVAMDNFYTKEEMKMVWETRKMLHEPNLPISATCVRVPVLNSHAVSIALECEKPFTLGAVEKVLKDFPGIVVVNDIAHHQYPTSMHSNGNDLVYVGRIRRDLACENGILLYVVGDNIRKGAASNAVQIIERMVKEHLL
ncbi:MAG: aspartate-semialdehyde dehydrogenase [Bacilli bacterium]|nr:aspartate-semialdehyde dehydrogenase [Bacilli bacterium]